MRQTKAEKEAQEEAKAWLLERIKPGKGGDRNASKGDGGTQLYCVLRHVSKSGMQRSIGILMVDSDGGIDDISGWVALAVGWRRDYKRGGVIVSGCGMDMGFHLVYCLAATLFGEGYLLPQARWM
jgi:hypothetical protein